jgi:hypothetical protein
MMMEGEESDEKPTNCEDAEHDKEDDTMELRVFRVVIHLRSFKASMLLPRRSVNAYVRLLLPSQIVQLAVASSQASSKLTTPLRTHPPVPVDRGTEVNIPNGYFLSLSPSLCQFLFPWGFFRPNPDSMPSSLFELTFVGSPLS